MAEHSPKRPAPIRHAARFEPDVQLHYHGMLAVDPWGRGAIYLHVFAPGCLSTHATRRLWGRLEPLTTACTFVGRVSDPRPHGGARGRTGSHGARHQLLLDHRLFGRP